MERRKRKAAIVVVWMVAGRGSVGSIWQTFYLTVTATHSPTGQKQSTNFAVPMI
jgi:hypothetical protein